LDVDDDVIGIMAIKGLEIEIVKVSRVQPP
jgi:hypothetical protein